MYRINSGGSQHNSLTSLIGRVHNLDCLEIINSIPDGSVNMVFADPPFNLNKKYNTYKDNLDFSEYMKWTGKWLTACSRILREDGSLFLYNIPKLLAHTTPVLNELLEFRHWIAWNSNGKPLGKTLQPAHYGILFYTKSLNSKFYDVRTDHPRCKQCGSYLKDYGGKEHLRHPVGVQISDVWNDIHRARHNKRRIPGHPCQLPVHLIERLMLMSTDPGDLVFDPFCGGGSAAIAAKQMGRHYIGTDIDPEYVSIANRRYSEAVEVNDENGHNVSFHLGKLASIRDVDCVQDRFR